MCARGVYEPPGGGGAGGVMVGAAGPHLHEAGPEVVPGGGDDVGDKGGGAYVSWEEIYGQRVGFLRSCETGRIGSLSEVVAAVEFRLGQTASHLRAAEETWLAAEADRLGMEPGALSREALPAVVPGTEGLIGERKGLQWVLNIVEGPSR